MDDGGAHWETIALLARQYSEAEQQVNDAEAAVAASRHPGHHGAPAGPALRSLDSAGGVVWDGSAAMYADGNTTAGTTDSYGSYRAQLAGVGPVDFGQGHHRSQTMGFETESMTDIEEMERREAVLLAAGDAGDGDSSVIELDELDRHFRAAWPGGNMPQPSSASTPRTLYDGGAAAGPSGYGYAPPAAPPDPPWPPDRSATPKPEQFRPAPPFFGPQAAPAQPAPLPPPVPPLAYHSLPRTTVAAPPVAVNVGPPSGMATPPATPSPSLPNPPRPPSPPAPHWDAILATQPPPKSDIRSLGSASLPTWASIPTQQSRGRTSSLNIDLGVPPKLEAVRSRYPPRVQTMLRTWPPKDAAEAALVFAGMAPHSGLPASAVPRVPEYLARGTTPISDIFNAAVGSYWRAQHPLFPVLHRASFEAAFAGDLATVYGGQTPHALLYAVAACGARSVPLAAEAQRVFFSRWCCDRAREVLMARRPGDLEAVQATALLVACLATAGVPGRVFPLLRRAALGAEALFFALPEEPPETPLDWVRRECVVRLRIVVAGYDLAAARYSDREPFGTYFHQHAWPIPCAERFFDDGDAVAAFSRLVAQPPGNLPGEADFSESDWPGASAAARALASAFLSGRGSVLAAAQLANYALHLAVALRGAPSRESAALIPALADAVTSLLPPDAAREFSAGNPRPLLSLLRTSFPDPLHPSSVLQSLARTEAHASAALSGARVRGAALARFPRFLGLLRGLMSCDPGLESAHSTLVAPCYTVGTALLAELRRARAVGVRLAGLEGAEDGLRTVAACLAAAGRNYGMQPRKVSELFHDHLRDAGVPARPPAPGDSEVEDLPDERTDGRARFFWDALLEDRPAGEGGGTLPRLAPPGTPLLVGLGGMSVGFRAMPTE